jgi:fatty acid-binding protein DegV
LAAVTGRAEAVAARVRVVGALAGSEHLARSGRVPGVAARAADRLGVRPMFELAGGRVRPLRPTVHDGDLDRMARLCASDRPSLGSSLHAVVMHAGAPERAARLQERLRELHGADVVVGPFGPAMVAHTGPGLLGVAWWWDAAGGDGQKPTG